MSFVVHKGMFYKRDDVNFASVKIIFRCYPIMSGLWQQDSESTIDFLVTNHLHLRTVFFVFTISLT